MTNQKEKRPYEKPLLEKVGPDFALEILNKASGKPTTCRPCSACHACSD